MQNITSPGAKLGGLSPLSWGLLVAGSLFFAIVVIVRQVTAPTPAIGQATQAGAAAIQLPLQNSVSGALPAFSLQPTEQAPEAEWLEVRIVGEARVVFADWWFDCRYVAVGGAYYAIGDAYVVTGWPKDEQFQALPAITRRDISEVCHGQ